MEKNALPKFLQSALWSYDISKFDLKDANDRAIVIQSILNKGTDEQLAWLLNRFSEKDLKAALKSLRRGSWWPDSLNYWAKVLGLTISSRKYEEAIQNINPKT
jgi:hypothetical protein